MLANSTENSGRYFILSCMIGQHGPSFLIAIYGVLSEDVHLVHLEVVCSSVRQYFFSLKVILAVLHHVSYIATHRNL